MNTADQQKMVKKHWAIELRDSLFFSGSHFYNQFIREITANLEQVAGTCVTHEECEAIYKTLRDLGNHIAQLEGQKGNDVHRRSIEEAALKSCSSISSTPTPFIDAIKEYETKVGFIKAKKLEGLRSAGDMILCHAEQSLMKDDKSVLTKLLIDIYRDIQKQE